MKTTKPFSTISYNSIEFLDAKLKALYDRRVLSFYAFVYHYAEEDESKNHIHLICFPNGQYQTDQLHDYLQELDAQDPMQPLGIMPIRSSKWEDWYLYSSHDASYLASKGQVRKYHYQESDFHSPSKDYLHEIVCTIDRTKYAKTQDFVNAVQGGSTFIDLVTKGQIPAPQFNQWKAMYDYLQYQSTYRNNRPTHTPLPNRVDENGQLTYERPQLVPTDETDTIF